MIMENNGENIITFVNESLYVQYLKSTWWIDLGTTIHVAGIPSDADYAKKRDKLKWQMESRWTWKLLVMFL